MNDQSEDHPTQFATGVHKQVSWGMLTITAGSALTLLSAVLLGAEVALFVSVASFVALYQIFRRIETETGRALLLFARLDRVKPLAPNPASTQTGLPSPMAEDSDSLPTVRIVVRENLFEVGDWKRAAIEGAAFLNSRTGRNESVIGVYHDDRIVQEICCSVYPNGEGESIFLSLGTVLETRLLAEHLNDGDELRFQFEGGEWGFLTNQG